MKNIVSTLIERLAESACAELEGPGFLSSGSLRPARGGFAERLEESFVTVAFAEAADYDQIHDALGSEQRPSIERPDDCAFGDNDLCFIEV